MSKAPDKCMYCKGDDPNCGFCDGGKPLDTQEDWDKSWGKVLNPTYADKVIEVLKNPTKE